MNTFTIIRQNEMVQSYYANELRYYINGAKLCGRLMNRLGITNQTPIQDVVASIIDNKHPITREQLRPNKSSRVAFSFCVSAPKCLSILYELTEDPRLLAIHKNASNISFRVLESFADVRRRKNGADYSVATCEAIWLDCTHHLSRRSEPQLHDHKVVLNITYDETEKTYKAIDPGRMGTQTKLATQIYRNEVVYGLKQIAISAKINNKGEVEIAQIPHALCEKYSTRKKDIDGFVERFLKENKEKECGKKFRAKVANEFKDPKLTPAQEVAALEKFRAEMKETKYYDILVDMVDNAITPIAPSKSANDILVETLKRQKSARINKYDFLRQVFIASDGNCNYKQIISAFNDRVKNKTINCRNNIIQTNEVNNINTELDKVCQSYDKTLRRITPQKQEQYNSRHIMSPIAQKACTNQDAMCIIKEDERNKLTFDINEICEVANYFKIPVYYLNARRKIQRDIKNAKKISMSNVCNITKASLIVIDNATHVDEDHMLKIIKQAKSTKSKVIMIATNACPNLPTKVLYEIQNKGYAKEITESIDQHVIRHQSKINDKNVKIYKNSVGKIDEPPPRIFDR